MDSKVGEMTGYRVGVDIGGTFTDIVLINEAGELLTKKISSSVGDRASTARTIGFSSKAESCGCRSPRTSNRRPVAGVTGAAITSLG